MGDENTLAGVTKAHKHSALSTDGGFIETGVTGVTNLSEGSIVYGDASEIVTELTAGATGTALQINGAGLPVWATAGSVGKITLLDNTILTADQTTFDTSFTSVSQGDEMSSILAVFNGSRSTTTGMYLNIGTGGSLITGGTDYYYSGVTWDGGAVSYTDSPNNSIWEAYPSGKDSEHISLIIHLWASDSTIATSADQTINMTSLGMTGVSASTNVGSYFWGNCNNGGTAVSSLDQIKFTTASGNFLIGSQLAIYKMGV